MVPNIAIVGATGAVGEMMRKLVEERNFPFRSIRFLASPKSAGKKIQFKNESFTVGEIRAEAFKDVQIVLSSTPSSISLEWSPIAAKAGALVIDNSSAWRMDPQVPLVVPEVNAHALSKIPKGIIANPNCSTIQMVVALKPLHDRARIKRIVVCTYQASSGKGATGVKDLDAQLIAVANHQKSPNPTAHAGVLAGNVLSYDWKLGEDGYSEEEWKMVWETKKILGDENILVSPTTVRVPVRVGHCEALHVEFHSPLSVADAEQCLKQAPGVVFRPGYGAGRVPEPREAEGRDEVFVGRLRKDPTVPNGLALWVVADNLRKGAATNAVQIAELLIKDKP